MRQNEAGPVVLDTGMLKAFRLGSSRFTARRAQPTGLLKPDSGAFCCLPLEMPSLANRLKTASPRRGTFAHVYCATLEGVVANTKMTPFQVRLGRRGMAPQTAVSISG